MRAPRRPPRQSQSKDLRTDEWFEAIRKVVVAGIRGEDEACLDGMDEAQRQAVEAIAAINVVIEHYGAVFEADGDRAKDVFHAMNLLDALIDGRAHPAVDFFNWSRSRSRNRPKGPPLDDNKRATIIAAVEALEEIGEKDSTATRWVVQRLVALGQPVTDGRIRSWRNRLSEDPLRNEAVTAMISEIKADLLTRSDRQPSRVLDWLGGFVRYLKG